MNYNYSVLPKDGATGHTSNPACEKLKVFKKQNDLKKTFGHLDLPI
jgi:hypothetical protein